MRKKYIFVVQKLMEMKKLFCLIYPVLFAVATLSLLLDTQTLSAQVNVGVATADMSISSEPESDAEVYLDGILIGTTPLLRKIEVGHHQIVVKKELFYDHVQEIDMTDDRLTINVKMKPKYGYAKIDTKPMGATVFVDGTKCKSVTSLISDKLSAGRHEVSIHCENYKDVDTAVVITENSMTTLNVTLEKQHVYQEISKEQYENQLVDEIALRKLNKDSLNVMPKPRKKSKVEHGLWIKAGGGLSHVWGEDVQSWSSGNFYSIYPTYYGGIQYTASFNRFVGIGLELSYSKTGYQYMYEYNDSGNNVIDKYEFRGFDLPLTLRLHFMKGGVGPVLELGALVNYKLDYYRTRQIQSGSPEKTIFKYGAFNYGCVAGLGGDFRIGTVMCTVNARAVMEMSSVFKDMKHNMVYFQFGIGVNIF